ncbi:MAG: GDSL family lipase [Paenibacillus sp. RIFOXYA1_FULL_44_5]|nr:MAG: GDSL family lipase [Paenibacillus sp. RIFOXYA1_FULL_44_5]
MIFEKQDKLIFIGDSITDCGRRQPIGEAMGDTLGNGYVSLVNSFIHSVYPDYKIRVVNMGTSGHTVKDLQARWKTDVVDLQPDWLSIMIGVNDVWRQYDQPLITESHVYIEEYESTLEQLVKSTLPSVKGIILMTPFYMEPNPNDAMRHTLDQYGSVIKKLAQKYNTTFVDTQAAIDSMLQHMYPAFLGWDRVHPNQAGHMTVARAFLEAVGFSWTRN